MADYKFNGVELREKSNRLVAKVDKNIIRDANGSKKGQIDKNIIRDDRGARIGQVDKEDIRDASNHKISTMAEVRKIIDGPGGVTLAALWLIFIR